NADADVKHYNFEAGKAMVDTVVSSRLLCSIRLCRNQQMATGARRQIDVEKVNGRNAAACSLTPCGITLDNLWRINWFACVYHFPFGPAILRRRVPSGTCAWVRQNFFLGPAGRCEG